MSEVKRFLSTRFLRGLALAAAGLAAGSVGSAAVLFHEELDGATPYVATPKVIPDTPGPYQQEIDGRELDGDSWLDFRNDQTLPTRSPVKSSFLSVGNSSKPRRR
jgi:hypothetical protein